MCLLASFAAIVNSTARHSTEGLPKGKKGTIEKFEPKYVIDF